VHSRLTAIGAGIRGAGDRCGRVKESEQADEDHDVSTVGWTV
jgi:hypothetical protein